MTYPARLLFGLVFCLGFSAAALAQAAPSTSAAPAPIKVGTINIQEAISTCDEGKKDLDALQKRFAPKQAELQKLSDEIDALKKQYEAQAPKLTQQERDAHARAIQAKEKTLRREFDDAQSEFQQAQQEMATRIYNKMAKVLADYAKANGYAVILDISAAQTPVLWRDASTEVTANLIAAYNAQNTTRQVGMAGKPVISNQ